MYNTMSWKKVLVQFIWHTSEGLEAGEWMCTSVRSCDKKLLLRTNTISIHSLRKHSEYSQNTLVQEGNNSPAENTEENLGRHNCTY